jgi:hypothetical protein
MLHGLKQPEETNSSCNRTFSALAPDTVIFKEVLHGGGNLYSVRLGRKMSGVKELNRNASARKLVGAP